jgi:Uma2 family endonuclease
MRAKVAESDQFTIEEYLAMTAERPEGERWELIEGIAILSPSPSNWHQIIAGNVFMALGEWKLQHEVAWVPLLGTGTRVPISPRSLPQPDVMVLPMLPDGPPNPVSEEALVLFEVLYKSNTKADQAWRRRVYASVVGCEHYVTIEHNRAEVIRYDRANGWAAGATLGFDDGLALPALGDFSVDVTALYRWTPVAKPAAGRG